MSSARRLLLLGVLVVVSGTWAAPTAHAADRPGHWGWPLAGAHPVSRGFAPPAQAWLPGHRGVDLRGRPRQVVRAAGAGLVHFAGRIGGVGVVSVLHPGGLLTTYEPVRPLVHAGDAVLAGQPIGRLTLTGSHCLPAACLHWGLRRGPAYLDPLALVGAARVRLLPLSPGPGDLPPGPTGSAAGGVVLFGGVRPGQQLLRRHRRGP